ncbi:hypothetical protein GGR54DRAFT_582786 [Hypoxylon sp. NC1633]|nr:hypothetical protein GGR54DRAFT_582786 [Hypoxylon sp. NC1633]
MDKELYDGDGGRPHVAKRSKQKKSKYRQDQSVYLLVPGGAKAGPYVIESVVSQKKYTLCTSDGTSVKNGDEVEDKDLQPADGGP